MRGKAALRCTSVRMFRDHPRVCGEKYCRNNRKSLQPRITPAYAGKRRGIAARLPLLRDHPRVCGEKGQPVPAAGLSEGSPPRMRGKVKKTQKGIQSAGITPACAGKSLSAALMSARSGDHPRMCGEKLYWLPVRSCCGGSPPHVRGKALLTQCRSAGVGITPACAGKSFAPLAVWFIFGDHPRMCGEKHS